MPTRATVNITVITSSNILWPLSFCRLKSAEDTFSLYFGFPSTLTCSFSWPNTSVPSNKTEFIWKPGHIQKGHPNLAVQVGKVMTYCTVSGLDGIILKVKRKKYDLYTWMYRTEMWAWEISLNPADSVSGGKLQKSPSPVSTSRWLQTSTRLP